MNWVFKDKELVESLKDEPELLAIADAFTQTVGKSRFVTSRRLLTRKAVLGAAVGAAAIAALILGLPAGSKSFTDRALAAVAPGRVVHAVLVYDSSDRLINTRTGRSRPASLKVEEWFDAETHETLFVSRIVGRTSDIDYTDSRGRQFNLRGAAATPSHPGRVDPPIATFLVGYRAALSERQFGSLGDATLNERRVRWLEIFSPAETVRSRVAVDLSTYKPIRVESMSAGHVVSAYSIEQIESLAGTSVFKRPTVTRGERSGAVTRSRPTTLAAARGALGGRLLLAKSSRYTFLAATVDALRSETRGAVVRERGVTLRYKDQAGNEIELQEALRGHLAYGWPAWLAARPLPSTTLYESAPSGATLFRADGVYVTIRGGLGDPNDLAALAKSLRAR